MADDPVITITPSQIEEKRAEVREHEARIAHHQEARARAAEWLRAAEILTGLQVDESPAAADGQETNEQPQKQDLTGAIERIAVESPGPVTKAAMREKLRDEGFPDDRLANYFYTAVMRLKNKGRIKVLQDGRIWRPVP